MGARLKFIKHYIFWLFGLVYLWTLYLKFFDPSDSLLNHYLADLVCIPIVLYLSVSILRIFKRDATFELSKLMVLFAVIYFSFLFELVLPFISNKYTSDWFDVLCYFIGGGIYVLILSCKEKGTGVAPL